MASRIVSDPAFLPASLLPSQPQCKKSSWRGTKQAVPHRLLANHCYSTHNTFLYQITSLSCTFAYTNRQRLVHPTQSLSSHRRSTYTTFRQHTSGSIPRTCKSTEATKFFNTKSAIFSERHSSTSQHLALFTPSIALYTEAVTSNRQDARKPSRLHDHHRPIRRASTDRLRDILGSNISWPSRR